MAWDTTTFRPPNDQNKMERTIKIVKQTIISNKVAKVGNQYKLSSHLCDIHVGAGNAIYIEDGEKINRSIGLAENGPKQKARRPKKRG